MSSRNLVAGRYAQALAETVSDNGELAGIREQLERLAQIVAASRPLRQALLNPVIDQEAKLRVILTLAEKLGVSDRTRRFLETVAGRNRLALLGEITEQLTEIVDRREGIHEAEVTSAVALDSGVRDRLIQALEKKTGGKVRLVEKMDSRLMGGLVVRLGSEVFDGSLETRLTRLRADMLASEGAGPAG